MKKLSGIDFILQPHIAAKLGPALVDAIKKGDKRFVNTEIYFRKNFTPAVGVREEIIVSTDNAIQGVTNINRGEMPFDAYIIESVGLNYGFSPTVVAPGSVVPPSLASTVRFQNSEYANTFPTPFVNSNILLSAGGRPIIEGRVKKFLSNSFADYGNEKNSENLVPLEDQLLVMQADIFAAQLIYPVSILVGSVSAGTHFIEGVYYGLGITSKG